MKYYYYDVVDKRCVDALAPLEVNNEDVLLIWDSLSRQDGSFLGICCTDDICVQFMWEFSGMITIDLPYPDKGGSMTKLASYDESTNVIKDVLAGGDPEKLSGLRFMKW